MSDDTVKEFWPDGSLKSQKPKPNMPPAIAETATSGSTTKGKDLGSKGKSGAGMPKQDDYATTAEWSAAMRKYRAEGSSDPQVAGQKSAIKNLRGNK